MANPNKQRTFVHNTGKVWRQRASGLTQYSYFLVVKYVAQNSSLVYNGEGLHNIQGYLRGL